MHEAFEAYLNERLDELRQSGLYKHERVLASPQQSRVVVRQGTMLNLCANNYLGLAHHPRIRQAAQRAIDTWGFGLASVRFICGTQQPHKQLEARISAFLGTEDAVLYGSCFDANGGLFETLLTEHDAIISDQLNHASVIDGVRLCKAKRYVYANNDMDDLAARLKDADAAGARFKLIATDGVFSMDGFMANLPAICDLADRHDALVMVDDSHATGFIGATGRGTPEHHGVADRIDILTSTFGKALGGACGGFTAGRRAVIELLRQRSRPYLFSNTLPPPAVAGAIESLDLLTESTELRDRLESNTRLFRQEMARRGLDILPGSHPIVPIMLHDAAKAAAFAQRMLDRGVYVIAFSHPVVPHGKARIRTQVSASHTQDDLHFAAEQFGEVSRTFQKELGK